MDYFGNLRSPLWDEMDQMEEQNGQINEQMPQLLGQIDELQKQLMLAQRKTAVCEIFKPAAELGMKAIVAKLSGFAKFEIDHKMTPSQFYDLVLKISSPTEEGAEAPTFSQELFDRVCGVFSKALSDEEVPFKGDLNNELYLSILAVFRTFDPAAAE